jgi:hypothetical protein
MPIQDVNLNTFQIWWLYRDLTVILTLCILCLYQNQTLVLKLHNFGLEWERNSIHKSHMWCLLIKLLSPRTLQATEYTLWQATGTGGLLAFVGAGDMQTATKTHENSRKSLQACNIVSCKFVITLKERPEQSVNAAGCAGLGWTHSSRHDVLWRRSFVWWGVPNRNSWTTVRSGTQHECYLRWGAS